MSRKKKSNVLRSVIILLACAAVLAFVLKDYLVPIMEGWQTTDFSVDTIINWLLWAVDLRESP